MANEIQALLDVIHAQKSGNPRGIFSICSANPAVIRASLQFGRENDIPMLIESTCNQVNQFGGYTGMRPGEFAAFVHETAKEAGYPVEKLILGGDHLGPYPWRNEPAKDAMAKAREMVGEYVSSGYTKIHLDASMHCGDDDLNAPLPLDVSTKRAAQICRAAEDAANEIGLPRAPLYVIGSEVPAPGGQVEEEDSVQATRVADVKETIEVSRKAFIETGLADAWDRVIAVVVQPGLEFGEFSVIPYDRTKTEELSSFIKSNPQMVYEAHSTDYQAGASLKALVEDGFAILKVGPEFTFAYREAIFALEMIERELSLSTPSGIIETLHDVMCDDPHHWESYYTGDGGPIELSMAYSYLDRIRYYWPDSRVQDCLQRLFMNLRGVEIPESLVHQFFPMDYADLRGKRFPEAGDLLQWRLFEVLGKYQAGCVS